MTKTILLLPLAFATTALNACNRHEDSGGVSAEESQQLNNAAEMLDASPDSLAAGNDTPLGNGDTDYVPADEAAAGNSAAGE